MKRLYVKQAQVTIEDVAKLGKTRDEMQKMHDEKTWPVEYHVEKVVGSTSPRIGAVLSEDALKDYCDRTGEWTVEIK